ncbi:hypothetical protein [Dissulfurimicrobium hydrothermale]|nr:hypothetical protein [Dissulfurimicrobium hydrothermale]
MFKGLFFLVMWIGCASLHTYFDLKVKPVLSEKIKQWSETYK